MAGRTDPDITYRYTIEFKPSAIQCVRFSECTGLKATTAVTSMREGGNNAYEVSMIDGQTFDDLVIKKGFYAAGSEFFEWMQKLHVKTKKIERVDISVIVLNDKFEETGRYNCYGCYPIEYEAPTFNATAKDIAFESIKIHYDYFVYHPGNATAGLIDAGLMAASNTIG